MKILSGFALGILAVVGLGLAVIYSGIYNVAAVEPHNPVVRWALDTTMLRSVTARAGEVEVPAQFREPQVLAGAEHYESTCAMYHGAPGREASEAGKGLRPRPPELARAAAHWSNGELFWIVKHGIKMTGMPAFGSTHGDGDIWALVAFLDRLPELDPAEYESLTVRVRQGQNGGGDGSHFGGRSALTGLLPGRATLTIRNWTDSGVQSMSRQIG